MVLKCCVKACNSKTRGSLAFHAFPTFDPKRRRLWLFALNMDVNTPPDVVNKMYVCHKHFKPDDYYCYEHPDPPTGRILKTTAVPAQFRDERTCSVDEPTASAMYPEHPDPLVSMT